MQNIHWLVVLALVITSLISCGNPVALEKDLRRHEDKTQSLEEQNEELQRANEYLMTVLQNQYVSDHHLWFIAGIKNSFDDARELCKEVGYSLPSLTELNEFKVQVFDKQAEWQDIKIDKEHFNTDMMHTTPPKLETGITVCKKDRKN